MSHNLLALICVVLLANFAAAADQLAPAEELKQMHGNWKVAFAIGGATTNFGETPEIIQHLGDNRLEFKIEGNRLSFGCIRTIRGETLTLCNDVPFASKQEQVQNSVRGDRLLLLTQESGKGLLASYAFSGDRLTIRYPAGCCSRSGNVITLERQK